MKIGFKRLRQNVQNGCLLPEYSNVNVASHTNMIVHYLKVKRRKSLMKIVDDSISTVVAHINHCIRKKSLADHKRNHGTLRRNCPDSCTIKPLIDVRLEQNALELHLVVEYNFLRVLGKSEVLILQYIQVSSHGLVQQE